MFEEKRETERLLCSLSTAGVERWFFFVDVVRETTMVDGWSTWFDGSCFGRVETTKHVAVCEFLVEVKTPCVEEKTGFPPSRCHHPVET